MRKAIVFATFTVLALAACDRPEPVAEKTATVDASSPPDTSDATPAPSVADPASPIPSAPVATSIPPVPLLPLTPDQKGEKGARDVIAAWAHGLEQGDYGQAWAQYRRGTDPTRAAFTKWWQRYRDMKVSIGAGEMDAGAGSLFYTAPITITGKTADGKPFRLEGPINLRRVNDVDGATADQLRWHIGNTDLKTVSS